MGLQNFVDKVGPVVSAAWLNTLDTLKYSIFADAATKAQARTNLTSDDPMEIVNGGTGARTPADARANLGISAAETGWPQTADELALGITPIDTGWPPGDIRRYGAVGDGAHAAANNAAITTALLLSTSTGLPVFIGATNDYYLVSQAFTAGDNTTIKGDGLQSQVLQSAAEKNIFVLGNDCTIDGVYTKGPGATSVAAFESNNGIYADGKHGIRIKNNYSSHWVAAGIQLRACTEYLIEGNMCFHNQNGANNLQSDILIYSLGAPGSRGIITHNQCYSNGDQGIAVNVIGYDTDVIVTDNQVNVLDDNWDEVVESAVVRRHGIMISYQATVNTGGRAIVSNNIVRNCRKTGIYRCSGITPTLANTSPVIISNNFISKVGWDAIDADLCGGIFLNNGGAGDTVSNNMIVGFAGVGGQNTGGAIVVVTQQETNPGHTIIRGNFINSTSGHGILLSSKVKFVTVADNRILGSTENDIQVFHTAGVANCGGHSIHNNYIKRSTGFLTGIDVRLEAAAYESYISNNVIVGQDIATPNNLRHAGILCDVGTSRLLIRDNLISYCYYGIVAYAFPAGRGSNPNIRRNSTRWCSVGVHGNSGAVLVDSLGVFEGSYNNTIASVGGAAYRTDVVNGGTWLMSGNAAPTNGTWALGDQVVSASPVGYIGFVCTAAGNPGEWKQWGAIP